jgi:hypothetical protein
MRFNLHRLVDWWFFWPFCFFGMHPLRRVWIFRAGRTHNEGPELCCPSCNRVTTVRGNINPQYPGQVTPFPIWLEADDTTKKITVSVSLYGKWYPVIDEFNGGLVSHIVEPAGIERRLDEAFAAEFADPKNWPPVNIHRELS